MENLKGCLDCKHARKSATYLLCTHHNIARHYKTFDSATGRTRVDVVIVKAAVERNNDYGKCKREAIYFEPTRYYKFKQWLKQLLK